MTIQRPTHRLTTPQSLIGAGLAAPERLAELEAVAERYAIGLTPALATLVQPGDPADPIARQFVPDARELIRDPAERDDPIGDDAMSPVKGLVHRYPDRVLIKLVAVCAVYCRFCFRRERVGPGAGSLSAVDFAAALDYVRAHTGVCEGPHSQSFSPLLACGRSMRPITPDGRDNLGSNPGTAMTLQDRAPTSSIIRIFAILLSEKRNLC